MWILESNVLLYNVIIWVLFLFTVCVCLSERRSWVFCFYVGSRDQTHARFAGQVLCSLKQLTHPHSPFCNWCHLYFLCCPNVLSRTSSSVLNRSGESGHGSFFLDLRRTVCSLSPLNIISVMDFHLYPLSFGVECLIVKAVASVLWALVLATIVWIHPLNILTCFICKLTWYVCK